MLSLSKLQNLSHNNKTKMWEEADTVKEPKKNINLQCTTPMLDMWHELQRDNMTQFINQPATQSYVTLQDPVQLPPKDTEPKRSKRVRNK